MSETKQEILDAFDKMWGLFPSPVFLIHASRKILAVNNSALQQGVTPGIQCHSLYPCDTKCPGCLADKSLKNHEAIRKCALDKRSGLFLDGYWVPVQGEDDVYVHFGIDITKYVNPELLG